VAFFLFNCELNIHVISTVVVQKFSLLSMWHREVTN
jgi:hypothetical protein